MVANNMRRNDFIKPLTHELLKNVEREINDKDNKKIIDSFINEE